MYSWRSGGSTWGIYGGVPFMNWLWEDLEKRWSSVAYREYVTQCSCYPVPCWLPAHVLGLGPSIKLVLNSSLYLPFTQPISTPAASQRLSRSKLPQPHRKNIYTSTHQFPNTLSKSRRSSLLLPESIEDVSLEVVVVVVTLIARALAPILGTAVAKSFLGV